jgi:hypothetical protein
MMEKKSWDKLQVARSMVKMGGDIRDMPVAFSLLCDEVRVLKRKVKELENGRAKEI